MRFHFGQLQLDLPDFAQRRFTGDSYSWLNIRATDTPHLRQRDSA
jgi:hypothetical protein